ncbi:hypothetical protein Scep_013340 [Stephania cephalantha]|uniref:KIB1-4 beta-propeller domain-containing protein n=1 Tax=Stephania cephalantha TaxID=152367 RepID=A0AAP0JH86_9MAGN
MSNIFRDSLKAPQPFIMTTPLGSRVMEQAPSTATRSHHRLPPPPAFFRSRSVCKRWYSLIFSNTFLQLYLDVSPRRHWFIFFKRKTLKSYIYRNNNNKNNANNDQQVHHHHHHQSIQENCEGYLYDPLESAWYRLVFSSVPPSGFSPASSSGGLVCWVSDDAGPKTLILSNPIVKTFAQLPPTLRPRLFPSIGLIATDASIHAVVAGDDLISPFAVKNLTTETFHIDTNGFYSIWGTTSALPRLCSLESGRMVFVEDKFYCMNYSPFSILSYDVSSNQWLKIQAPMRRFLRSPSLVECRGRLVLVAAVEKSKLNVPRSMRLWGLQGNSGTANAAWVEVERMPQQLYEQFVEEERGSGFDCVGHGDFIVITVRGSSERILLFDFYRKVWHWVPQCPFVACGVGGVGGGGGDGNGLHGLAFEPRLATPAMALLDQPPFTFQSFGA